MKRKATIYFTTTSHQDDEPIQMSMQKELTADLPGDLINNMFVEIQCKFNKPVVNSIIFMSEE